MRKPKFPIEGETRNTIEYILDTVLYQTGSATFETADVTVEVSTVASDNTYYGEGVFLVTLTRMPREMKVRWARYTGFVTSNRKDVLEYLMSLQTETSLPKKSLAHTKKTCRPIDIDL